MHIYMYMCCVAIITLLMQMNSILQRFGFVFYTRVYFSFCAFVCKSFYFIQLFTRNTYNYIYIYIHTYTINAKKYILYFYIHIFFQL